MTTATAMAPSAREVTDGPTWEGKVLLFRPSPKSGEVLLLQPLTVREKEVLSWVAEGYSNKLIAAQLTISERTVKSHLTSIMVKLAAFDRTHAVVTAVRKGCLSI